MLLLVLQLLLLFGFFVSFAQYLRYYVGLALIFTAVMLFFLLNRKGNPSIKLLDSLTLMLTVYAAQNKRKSQTDMV